MSGLDGSDLTVASRPAGAAGVSTMLHSAASLALLGIKSRATGMQRVNGGVLTSNRAVRGAVPTSPVLPPRALDAACGHCWWLLPCTAPADKKPPPGRRRDLPKPAARLPAAPCRPHPLRHHASRKGVV
eukprot:COSAG06_NODE_531_length_14564_cov_23.708400_3_plen_129_part_00